MERAVIDRIVEGLAVILVGDQETEYHLPVERLPEGAVAGSVVRVRIASQIVEIVRDEAGTAEAEQRIAGKLDRLRERGRKRESGAD